MLSRVVMVGMVLTMLSLGGLFFLSSNSYQDSFQARMYYFLGDYEQSYALAKRAYEKDVYNKMAFTVLTQSDIALQYEAYINEGNSYLEIINALSTKDRVSESDRGRIKMMSEIMIDGFSALPSSKLTEKDLKQSAVTMREKFEALYRELFGKDYLESVQ
jgi:hypothetical protein